MKNMLTSMPARGFGCASMWFALVVSAGGLSARAQVSTLRAESYYTNQRCLPPCACALGPIQGPLRGNYTLTFVTIGDVFDFYTIDNIVFSVSTPAGPVTLTGSGTYQQSEIINQQSMSLSLLMNNTGPVITLESGMVDLQVGLPYLYITLVNNSVPCQTFHMHFIGGPPVSCHADLDDGSTLGIPDEAVDVNDLVYFLAKFEQGSLAADLVGGPCGCVDCYCPGGQVDIEDLLFFLRRFERGC
jgi:hypothetical protein